MARLQAKSFATPDEVRATTHGKITILDLDDMVVGQLMFEPGWRWSEVVKPIAGTDLCEYHHIGVTISGTLRVQMRDGAELEIGPDTAYEIPPGHDAWVTSDEPYVSFDFAGMRGFAIAPDTPGERVLATILFTDVVDSTATAERLGDARWRQVLAGQADRVRYNLAAFRGREIKDTGDGFLAIFDGTARALRCASAIRDSVGELGIQIRAGVHTGEIEIVPNDVRGVAVHVASRIMALAGPGEILVSGTTHDLLAGSGLVFEDRGSHELKGLTGVRSVYALEGSAASPTRVAEA
jgi:class 3 adenylate cyclase